MNIEKKRIVRCSTGKNTIGHITLDKLAIPETVKVTLLGETIIPESFNCYGHPNFTKEQVMLYMFKEDELKRQNNGEYTPLEAEIVYEEKTFDVPRNTFDTIGGIKKSLRSLSALNQMLQNRKMFLIAHKNEKLNKFMIFGCFELDQYGQVTSVKKTSKGKLRMKGDVEKYKAFIRRNREGFTLTSGGYAIPNTGSVCPCCGKALTIDDVKNNPCVYIDGQFYHNSCYCNYRKLKEVYNFTSNMMDFIYKSTDYHFELLPNGYWPKDCCIDIPWFLFHTIDGDIVMGWRKHVISIEWQENYKSFDMNELFGNENVTKWEKSGKRGIHAWGEKKAYEYLKKVLEFVNSSYSSE